MTDNPSGAARHLPLHRGGLGNGGASGTPPPTGAGQGAWRKTAAGHAGPALQGGNADAGGRADRVVHPYEGTRSAVIWGIAGPGRKADSPPWVAAGCWLWIFFHVFQREADALVDEFVSADVKQGGLLIDRCQQISRNSNGNNLFFLLFREKLFHFAVHPLTDCIRKCIISIYSIFTVNLRIHSAR